MKQLRNDDNAVQVLIGLGSIILLFIIFIVIMGLIALFWGLINFFGALMIFISIIVLWKTKYKFYNPLFLLLFLGGILLMVGASFLGLEILPDAIDLSFMDGII